ncbi:hypothetical protein AAFF_G00103940 [Aldrovandia affinis]|uniref:Uncharacterized protein n=1 Tax=Aldrovandia affinis TaxID=143900 RepID=A0AAD7RU81_9TELE|nr:hypothetical protein AAFF_G00103940 [Aldrovandia affinis]
MGYPGYESGGQQDTGARSVNTDKWQADGSVARAGESCNHAETALGCCKSGGLDTQGLLATFHLITHRLILKLHNCDREAGTGTGTNAWRQSHGLPRREGRETHSKGAGRVTVQRGTPAQ